MSKLQQQMFVEIIAHCLIHNSRKQQNFADATDFLPPPSRTQVYIKHLCAQMIDRLLNYP